MRRLQPVRIMSHGWRTRLPFIRQCSISKRPTAMWAFFFCSAKRHLRIHAFALTANPLSEVLHRKNVSAVRNEEERLKAGRQRRGNYLPHREVRRMYIFHNQITTAP